MKNVKLDAIKIDGGTQARASLNESVVADYAEAIKGGASFPPVVVFFDGSAYWLADGFHRYHAYRQAGAKNIAADIRNGTRRDAILHSVGANADHGLRRTNDDKRRAVLTLLNDKEWSKWSDSEIAKRCAVSREYVNRLRPTVVTCDQVTSERAYTTRHGTVATMKTGNIGRSGTANPAPHGDTADDFIDSLPPDPPSARIPPSHQSSPPEQPEQDADQVAEPSDDQSSFEELRAALDTLLRLKPDDYLRICPRNKRAAMCQRLSALIVTFEQVKERVSG